MTATANSNSAVLRNNEMKFCVIIAEDDQNKHAAC